MKTFNEFIELYSIIFETFSLKKSGLFQEIKKLLGMYGFSISPELLKPDGIALIANLANFAAKTHDENFYNLKHTLCVWLINNHRKAYYVHKSNLLYVETQVGQVSFHIWPEEDEVKFSSDDYPWSGIETQFRAVSMLHAYLSKDDFWFYNYKNPNYVGELGIKKPMTSKSYYRTEKDLYGNDVDY